MIWASLTAGGLPVLAHHICAAAAIVLAAVAFDDLRASFGETLEQVGDDASNLDHSGSDM